MEGVMLWHSDHQQWSKKVFYYLAGDKKTTDKALTLVERRKAFTFTNKT